MKLFVRPKSFSEALRLVTIVNSLLGLRIFEYPRGHSRPVLSLIYLLLIYGLYCGGAMGMEEKYYANVSLMKLEYVLYQLLMYIINMSVIVKMLLGWWFTKKFKVCHKKIFEIDETLRQLGLSVNYDNIYFITIGTITTWIIGSFIMCIVVFIHLQIRTDQFSSIYIILVFTYSMTVNSINIFEFYIFVRCLKMKFELVNQLLCDSLSNLSTKEKKLGIFEMKDFAKLINVEQQKQILSVGSIFRYRQQIQSRGINISVLEKDPTVSQLPSQFVKQLKSNLQNPSGRYNSTMTICQERNYLLQVIKQVHLELCRTSKIICTILGVQTSWEIGITIMFLTNALYNLYVRYIMQQHKVKGLAVQTSMTLALSFLYIVKAVSLNRICKKTADEGNRTIEIIHAIYGCNADMQDEIQQFGIQILQSPVTFTAFGLTLDNRVLSLVFKTVTIYMVIMLQVSNTLESNNAVEYTPF